MIALIPARAGSKRIPGKNTKRLSGHPLIAYTIAAAQQSGVFDTIGVCSDDPVTLDYAKAHEVEVLSREPVPDDQPDIVWVREALRELPRESFAILRPTSPFRTADTIRRAYRYFYEMPCSSIRAVERTRQHPGKMWQVVSVASGSLREIHPLIGDAWPCPEPYAPLRCGLAPPWHSQPTQSLPPVYVQNASLEMAWTWCVEVFGTISGPKVYGFETQGYEGFDINEPRDWREAEYLIASGDAQLPEVHADAA